MLRTKDLSGILFVLLTATIPASGANHAPVAVPQNPYTAKNTQVSIRLAALDGDGDALTYSIVASPANGTVTPPSDATVVYTPNTNYSGVDQFTFKVNDGTVDSTTVPVRVVVQSGTVIRVGPTRTYKTPAAGIAAAHNFDVIEIDAGTYSGSAGKASIPNTLSGLTLRGVGGIATMDAQHSAQSKKAALVVSGKYINIENMRFTGAWIVVDPDGGNAAGIRMEGPADGGDLTIRNCRFDHNQNGILTGNSSNANGPTLWLINSELDNNHADLDQSTLGATHNIYVGHIQNFVMLNSYSHSTVEGHLVKTAPPTASYPLQPHHR